MIVNADILQFKRATGATAGGEVTYTAGPAIAAGRLRCLLDKVTTQQKFTLGAAIKDADAALYVRDTDLAAAGEEYPAVNDKLNVVFDGETALSGPSGGPWFQVLFIDRQVIPGGGGMSHHQLFVKKVTS